jgi:UTP--glucose-1-phosphate uridylyltransferase
MQITDALQIQAQQGKVTGYRFKGHLFDCGSVDGFIDATNYTYKAPSE